MAKELIEQIKQWRAIKAQEENVELYLVMQNKTIEAIAETLPKNEEEFIAIKGLGEKKFLKYGADILSIVKEDSAPVREETESVDPQDRVYSVSNFLNLINDKLNQISASVKGEISSIEIRERYLFFTIKDVEDDSCMSCFMWARDYDLCGGNLEAGIEIIVHGEPDIYKPTGRFSFQANAFELVGEGALKKAYDKLKKKLAAEGIFEESKRRQIPTLPTKIGLITSKTGAVIHDFGNNLGRFGFITKFYDSRVEGALAIRELTEAVKYFRDKEIDILVVIRGGGSLESLQAFNNEALIRQIADYPVPVLCGIGHDKDVTLFAMAADKAFSTPTAVAKELNKSWEQIVYKLEYLRSVIINKYQPILSDSRNVIEKYYSRLEIFYREVKQKAEVINQIYRNIFDKYSYAIEGTAHSIEQHRSSIYSNYQRLVRLLDVAGRLINNILAQFQFNLKNYNQKMSGVFETIYNKYNNNIESVVAVIKNLARSIDQNNPSRQLKLGYSIVFTGGKVVKSIHQVSKNDKLISRISDGDIISSVDEIKEKEYRG